MHLEQLIAPVIALAKQAGLVIKECRDHDRLDVRIKSDATPVTAADFKAHEIIDAGLKQLTPSVPCLSEEGQIPAYNERKTWDYYWLVDPLDGTRAFLEGSDEFTVNIALNKGSHPVLGVVYVPMQDECYFAIADGHAFYLDAKGDKTQLQICQPAKQPWRVLMSRHHQSKRLQALLHQLGSAELIPMSSALKTCLVAAGKADLYPRLGPSMVWDTAAAQCIVEQAGGQMLTLAGETLQYNGQESLKNPDFLVLGGITYKEIQPFLV